MQAAAWDVISPLFAGCDAGRSSQTVRGQSAHSMSQRSAPKLFCFPRRQTATLVSHDFPPPFQRCYLREGIRGWTLHSAVSSHPGGGCETPNFLWFATQQGAHRLAQEVRWPPVSGPTFPTEQCPAGQRDLFPTAA